MKSKKGRKYLLSFFMPILLLLIVYIIIGITPFEDKTILVADMKNQYISYLNYFKVFFSEPSTIFYSFTKTLGDNMFGLAGNYLFSPYNLITLFFTVDKMPYAVMLITLLKLGTAGVTAMMFFEKRSLSIEFQLIFTLSYSLMAYSIVYQQNIMWLDAVIFVPLISMGIDELIKNKSIIVYCLSLCSAIAFNFYTGYFLCIYSVIYFLYRFCLANTLSIKKLVKKFVLASLLAGGMVAVVFIPGKLALEGIHPRTNDFSFSNKFSLFSFPTAFLNGSFQIDNLVDGLPLVYCGIFFILFILLFFLSKVKTKNKMVSACFLSVFFASFYINFFNTIWHGFADTTWFPYRYSFLLSFALLTVAADHFNDVFNKIRKRDILILGTTFITYLIFASKGNLISRKIFLLNLLLILLFCFLAWINNGGIKRYCTYFFLLYVIADLTLNAYLSLNKMDYTYVNEYEKLTLRQEIIDSIHEDDENFYRIESIYRFNNNDAMSLNYNGITHYSSTNKTFVDKFVKALGYKEIGDYASDYHYGSTQFDDSFLGIKYILANQNEFPSSYARSDKGYLENRYAFNLAFLSSSSIGDIDIYNNSMFELKNELFQSFTASNDQLFTQIKEKEEQLINLEVLESVESKYEYLPIAGNANGKSRIRDIALKYYYRDDMSNESYLVKRFISVSEDPIYLYLPCFESRNVKLYINDVYKRDVLTADEDTVIFIGEFVKGSEFEIKLVVDDYDFFVEDFLLYSMNTELLKKGADLLNADISNLFVKGNQIKFNVQSIDLNRNQLILTIPYDESWNIYVDGQQIRPKIAMDTLITFELSPGEHSIEMNYIPKGLVLGFIISLFSSIIFVFAVKREAI